MATITSLVAFVIVGAAALAVDSSSFYVQQRKLQSAVDMAALAAASNTTSATAAATTLLTSNGIVPAALSVVTGTYVADPTVAASSRFTAGATGNAASVSTTIYAPMLLGQVFGSGASGGRVAIAATGRAALLPVAAFSVGSRLASLNTVVTNAVLSALIGGNVSLTLADYQSLVSAKVDVGTLLQGVAATIAGSSSTYASVLGTSVSLSTVLSVLKLSGVDGGTYAALASVLAALPSSNGAVALGSLVNLGVSANLPISSKLPATVTMSAYDILSQAIEIAAAGRTVSVDLGIPVPGIADATVSVTVGPTRPASAIAPYASTTTVKTSQVRIALTTKGIFPGLGFVSLPLVLDLGGATATTNGPSCASGTATLALAVTPSASSLAIGMPSINFPSIDPGPVVSLLGLTIAASGSATSGSSPTLETFVASDVSAGTVKTANSSAPAASLLSSALGNLKLSVGGAPLSPLIPIPTISALSVALASLAMPADTILDAVARSLGIGIGQADSWVTDLRCGSPTLVQ